MTIRRDPFSLPVEERVELLRSIAQEIQGEEDIKEMLEKCQQEGRRFYAYNGFEPSGRMHIAQALMTAINTNHVTQAGGHMIIYIADYFAMLNHKMGGDLKKIKRVGEYFVEIFKACGMDMANVEFVWSSDFIAQHQVEYFETLNNIMQSSTLARLMRTVTIMGRKEGDKLSVSQLLYPCMQATDVFLLGDKKIEVCQLGVDQRKVNMLARQIAPSLNRKAPIIVSHHMLMGLKGPEVKMSKSDPMGAIFVEDTREKIHEKIFAAVCPMERNSNPLIEYIRYIIIPALGSFEFEGRTYTDYNEVADNVLVDGIDENRLNAFKETIVDCIDRLIQPIRDHFNTPELQQLLRDVESYRVTR